MPAPMRPHAATLAAALAVLVLARPAASVEQAVTDWRIAPASAWQSLFDGRTLDGWTPKIANHPLGDNYRDTFRAEDGTIRVAYDKYDQFDRQFGHLFYKERLSRYVLSLEYRFVGEQAAGGPPFARRNSGVMLHAQAPGTMGQAQDFPISLEAQFLGGGRTTMNVCTPGTEIVIDGAMVKPHCTDSRSRPYTDDDGWVHAEVEALGGDRIRHYVDGRLVLEYGRPSIGGGVVNGYDPAVKRDGTPVDGGYLALQSESQPIEFRNIRVLRLPDR